MKQPNWSFSSLEKFRTCPKQFYHVRIAKDVVEPPGEAATWGSRVHKAIEDYLRDGKPLEPELSMYEKYCRGLADIKAEQFLIEHPMSINANMSPCEWAAEDVWCRAIADVLAVKGERALVWDHKTGKKKPSDQLALNALLVFIHYPEVEEVKSVFYWLKIDDYTEETFFRTEIPQLWQRFLPDLQQYNKAHETGVFNAKPSGLCNGWCAVESCPHWRPKRKK